jgi:ketosteroid isomerase-like protein
MSTEIVEIFLKGNAAINRGDWDALTATWDPHIVVRTDASWPEWGYVGRDAALAFIMGVRESWGSQSEVEEILDLGDRVLGRIRYDIRGPRSGVEGEQRFTAITTFRKNRAILIEYFLEHELAVESLGLEG